MGSRTRGRAAIGFHEAGGVVPMRDARPPGSSRRSERGMSNRPFGVLVLGALAIAIAVIRLVIGFQLLFGGSSVTSSTVAASAGWA